MSSRYVAPCPRRSSTTPAEASRRRRRLVRRERARRRAADVGERREAAVRLGVRLRGPEARVPAARHPPPRPGAGRAERPLPLETQQEAFLVLSGECRLLVEGEERLLGPWDFFHSPAGTEHIFVGAGDGPCVILMAGARSDDWPVRYRCRSSRRATARARRRRRLTRGRRTRGSSRHGGAPLPVAGGMCPVPNRRRAWSLVVLGRESFPGVDLRGVDVHVEGSSLRTRSAGRSHGCRSTWGRRLGSDPGSSSIIISKMMLSSVRVSPGERDLRVAVHDRWGTRDLR